MPLQGSSHVLSIPDLFGLVQQHRLSGILVVASATHERSFSFQSGQLVYTICTDPEHLLGRVVSRYLGIDADQLRSLLADDPEEGFLGTRMVRQGVISQSELDDLMERQIRWALREILSWKEWAFHFQSRESREGLPSLRMSTHALVFDVSRELDEWAIAESLFHRLDLIPRLTAAVDPSSIESTSEDPAIDDPTVDETREGAAAERDSSANPMAEGDGSDDSVVREEVHDTAIVAEDVESTATAAPLDELAFYGDSRLDSRSVGAASACETSAPQANGSAGLDPARDTLPSEAAVAVDVGPIEDVVREEVDGERTLHEILEQTTRPILHVAHAIARGITAGQLELDESRGGIDPRRVAKEFVLPPTGYRAAELLQALEPGGSRVGEVTFLAASNPVLAARVLRLCALYGMWREGVPLEFGRLLARLNEDALGATLVAEAVRGLFLAPPCRQATPIIRSSVEASIACHRLAELSRFADPELARMVALLQDVGRLMFMSRDPQAYQAMLRDSQQRHLGLLRAEEIHFGTDHCQLGADFARSWGFPESFCDAIRYHHAALRPPYRPLVALLRLANAVTGNDGPVSGALRKKMLKDVGLSPRALEDVQRAIREGGRSALTPARTV
ncbi:MAG: HDOD domain-containing protein [Planctomycetota bacterium]